MKNFGNIFVLAVVLAMVFALPAGAMEFGEAPDLAERVEAGELPPVEDRLPIPEHVFVVDPYESIGQYGGTARVGTIRPTSWGDDLMLMSCFSTLVAPNPELTELIPNIIYDYEHNEDMSVWTFHFRQGMKWSDGHPFTTADIMFWYEDVLLNEDLTPVVGTNWRSEDGEIVEVVALDEYTLEYRWNNPMPYFPNQVAHNAWDLYPKHYLSQFHPNYADYDELMEEVEDAGFEEWYEYFGNRNQSEMGTPMQPDLPTLTGFKMESISSDRRVFVRNPYFWKVDQEGNQLPYMDRLETQIVSDREVLSGMVISGALDFAAYQSDIRDYPMMRQYADEGNYNVNLWQSAMNDSIYMFNMTHEDEQLREIFQDVRFRRAMSLGIDRQEINEIIYYGQGRPAQYTVLDMTMHYNPEYEQAYIEYDPDEANRLLDEMGLDERDAEGFRLMPNGERLMFTIEYFDNETPKGPNVELVAQHWADLGIDARSRSISGELQGQRAPANLMDATIWHGDKATDVLFPFQAQFFVPGSPGWERTKWPLWGTWLDTAGEEGEEPPEQIKELRGWWDEMMFSPDDDRRAELADKILGAQAENLWTIGTISYAPFPVVASRDMRNVPEQGYWTWDSHWTPAWSPEHFWLDR